MQSSIATFVKLAVTFVTSFSVAFAGISLSLGNRLNVDLDWSHLVDGAMSVQKTAAKATESSVKYLMANVNTYADKEPEKTLIYTADAGEDQGIQNASSSSNQGVQSVVLRTASGRDNSESEGIILQSNIQNFVYYSQHDPRWKDFLYGGNDPIDQYGCGPTVVAMIVANLSNGSMTPIKAAQWAANNGFYADSSGSYHGIIAEGANAFGLDSSAFKDYSVEAVRTQLENGNIFGALMKPGTFTQGSGHFLLILGLDADGNAIIADSNSVENTKRTWPLEDLLGELKMGSSDGGPLWIIRLS